MDKAIIYLHMEVFRAPLFACMWWPWVGPGREKEKEKEEERAKWLEAAEARRGSR